MTTPKHTDTRDRAFLAQFAKSRRAVAKLARLYPGAFDEQGRVIVAVAALPKLKEVQHG